MGITLMWDNEEKTIIRWEFDGVWTWDEFGEHKIIFDAMLLQVKHVVDVIADMSRTPAIPRNSSTQFSKYNRTTPLNRGQIVFVGANASVRISVETLRDLFKILARRITFAETVDAARDYLSQSLQENV